MSETGAVSPDSSKFTTSSLATKGSPTASQLLTSFKKKTNKETINQT